MPEGPEVRVMADWLRTAVALPCRLSTFTVVSGRYVRHGFQTWPPAESTVTEFATKGKFLWWRMSCAADEYAMAFTMGMTGGFSAVKTKHTRLSFGLGDVEVHFNDPRNFGTCRVMPKTALTAKLATLGFDILEDFTLEQVSSTLSRRPAASLAEMLMDQRCFAGVGNYIKAEVLWQSRLAPTRSAGSLAPSEIEALFTALQHVPRVSRVNNGATIRNYVTPEQEMGRFSSLFSVYGRKTDPDGREVVKQLTADGRMTWWVPTRQC